LTEEDTLWTQNKQQDINELPKRKKRIKFHQEKGAEVLKTLLVFTAKEDRSTYALVLNANGIMNNDEKENQDILHRYSTTAIPRR
jgi:hypothetical protein